jgi:tetratricopeptide (TPR) repeat protein
VEPPLPLKWRNHWVYLLLGNSYRLKGQLFEETARADEARAFYRRSLDALVQAREIDQFTNRAHREFRLWRGSAREDIPDIGNAAVYESLCLTYAKMGQWEECVSAARYMQQIAPDRLSAYRLAGAAYFNLGRYDEAAAQFMAGMLLEPSNIDWLENLSFTYRQLGLPDPVSKEGTNVSLKTGDPDVRWHLEGAAWIVVRLFEGARRLDEAAVLRDVFLKQYAVPLETYQ